MNVKYFYLLFFLFLPDFCAAYDDNVKIDGIVQKLRLHCWQKILNAVGYSEVSDEDILALEEVIHRFTGIFSVHYDGDQINNIDNLANREIIIFYAEPNEFNLPDKPDTAFIVQFDKNSRIIRFKTTKNIKKLLI